MNQRGTDHQGNHRAGAGCHRDADQRDADQGDAVVTQLGEAITVEQANELAATLPEQLRGPLREPQHHDVRADSDRASRAQRPVRG
jgi:uncharacterized protein (DUF2267 family)